MERATVETKKGLDAAVNQNDSNNTVTVDSNNKVTNVNTG